MNILLTVTNIGYGLAFLLSTILGIVVYLKSSKKLLHILFLLLCTSIAVFQISHIIGINVSDPEASRQIFMFNLTDLFIAMFSSHWLMVAAGRAKNNRAAIATIYFVGLALFAYFVLNPYDFLLESRPKLYLPNYYEGGNYYWLMVAYFVGAMVYSYIQALISYFQTDILSKKKLKYYLWMVGIGYIFGSTAFFLVFNIPVDPIYSVIFSLYVIPISYGILKYDIMDVRVIAKKALAYAVFVMGIGLLISAINLANAWILVVYSDFPEWVVPLISGAIAVFFGGIVWEKLKELDVLKYEFVTIVTHKFRTPLTRIKWATELLKGKQSTPDAEHAVGEVEKANEFLVELTDTLAGLGRTEESQYAYDYEDTDIKEILGEVVKSADSRIKGKGIIVNTSFSDEKLLIEADSRRIRFVIQTLVENAVSYTPDGGTISIRAYKSGFNVFIEIEDSGMGISEEDISKMFTKFFRSSNAKKADTEGVGVGLFISKRVVERHGGTMSVNSLGMGKGSVFTIKLPAVRDSKTKRKNKIKVLKDA